MHFLAKVYMSGLFSAESLSLVLPAFIVFKLDKRLKLLHRGFPKYSPTQLEFQFIELILKLIIVLTIAAIFVAFKWTTTEPSLSLLSLLIVSFSIALIGKLSVDLLYMGIQNGVRGRTDPFVTLTSFPTAIFILVKSGYVDSVNPLFFMASFVTIFFTLSNIWLAELVEAKVDKQPSTSEIVKSSIKGYVKPSAVKEPVSHHLCRLVLHGSSPIVLALILFGNLSSIVFFSILLSWTLAIMYITPTLANSWAVIDSVRSPGMPLNQASVLLRFFNLSFSAIGFWLLGIAGIIANIYAERIVPSDQVNPDFDAVRDDLERLLVTGDYLDAAKLIRGSGIGTNSILQYLPAVETVSQILTQFACMAVTIHATQVLCSIVIRRLKLELQKYI